MAVNLTSGAIMKMSTGKCTANNLKPVVQVTYIHNRPAISDDEQLYWVRLSDGSFYQNGGIRVEAVRLNQLQEGSIVQLNDFVTYTIRKITVFLINDLNVIHSECDLIGNPEPFPHNDTPLVERSTPPIPDEDHVDVSHAHESVTSTQKCSETQSRKRKRQSSNETLVLEKSKPTIIDLDNSESDTNEDVDNGHRAQEPLATTQKDVSKLTKLMLEKNNEDDVGACIKKLETLEKDVTIMTKMMIEKNKEDDVGACLKKLEVFKDVSKMTRMIMEKNKENDVGACFKKLETLEEEVSKLTRMMMEKNKEDVVGFNKLEIL
ncbi:L10-interacting MYB domain-containing protein-like protein [Tanacetum coccineum]